MLGYVPDSGNIEKPRYLQQDDIWTKPSAIDINKRIHIDEMK
jgi:hypothetical protein